MADANIHTYDDRRFIALPGDHDATIDFAVKHFINTAQQAIESKGSFFVALSGGSTPKKIFEKLALPENRAAADWTKTFLFWGDERAVAPDDKDSNYKMAMDSGFAKLPIPKSQIFRMKAEKDIEKHAAEYEDILKKHLHGKGLDLVMLGMGDDGHTASLFPKTKALTVTDRWVVANEVPQKSCFRMTFTYPFINKAENIVFYIMGKDKSERVYQVLTDKNHTYPSSGIGTKEHPATFLLDQEASQELLKNWNPSSNSEKTG